MTVAAHDRFAAALGDTRGVADSQHRQPYGPYSDQVQTLVGAVLALGPRGWNDLPILDCAQEETEAMEALGAHDLRDQYERLVADVLAGPLGGAFFSPAIRALRLAALALIASPYIDGYAHQQLTEVARMMLGDEHPALNRPYGFAAPGSPTEMTYVIDGQITIDEMVAQMQGSAVTVVIDPLPSPPSTPGPSS